MAKSAVRGAQFRYRESLSLDQISAQAEGAEMAAPQSVARTRARVSALPDVRAAVWLSSTAFLALLVLYFVGLDQGATSIFGADGHIHEFLHDARHLLGFPCH
jgi:hypothetical protein